MAAHAAQCALLILRKPSCAFLTPVLAPVLNFALPTIITDPRFWIPGADIFRYFFYHCLGRIAVL